MRGQRLPSTRRASGSYRQRQERAAHRQHRGLKNVETINLVAIRPADRPGERACANDGRQARALCGREDLGVRQPADAPARVENHGGGHYGTGEGAAPGLIDAGDAGKITPRGRAHGWARRRRGFRESREWRPPRAPRRRRRSARWMAAEFRCSSRTWPGSSSCSSKASASAAPRTCSCRNSGTSARPARRFGCEKYRTLTSPRVRSTKAVSRLPLIRHHHRPAGQQCLRASRFRRRRSPHRRRRAPAAPGPRAGE